MAKYQVECPECGATYRVDLIGPHKTRDWKLENYDWTCDDCKEKARQEENTKAAATNEVAGLPALTGTEKQIAWAETVRRQKMESLELTLATLSPCTILRIKTDEIDKERLAIAIENIQTKESATWWIDNRDIDVRYLLKNEYERAEKPLLPKEKEFKAEALAEATIRPESPKTETIAEIRILQNAVEVIFPEKRDDFWQIIKKQLHFEWSGSSWKRTIKTNNGTPADRAAEVGHKLLAAGFSIRIFNEEIRSKAVSGSYEPECTRWVMVRTSGQYQGWFAVNWTEMNDNLYKAARKLPGSKWDKPSVVVPVEQFEEVIDFAGMYGFKLSEGAQEIASQARKVKEGALVAHVEEAEDKQPLIPGDKPKKLAVPEKVEVADEFKD